MPFSTVSIAAGAVFRDCVGRSADALPYAPLLACSMLTHFELLDHVALRHATGPGPDHGDHGHPGPAAAPALGARTATASGRPAELMRLGPHGQPAAVAVALRPGWVELESWLPLSVLPVGLVRLRLEGIDLQGRSSGSCVPHAAAAGGPVTTVVAVRQAKLLLSSRRVRPTSTC